MDTGRSGRHLELGRRGEQFAAEWLLAQGWTIVLRNHREGHRELDLVVTRGAVLAFVEVKSRRGTAFGHPFEAITRKKQAEVRRAARAWLTSESGRSWVAQRRRRVGGQIEFRFDAVAVRFGPRGQVDLEYLPDAWR